MARINVWVVGLAPLSFELAQGEVALLGRVPSMDRLPVEVTARPTRLVPVAGESVSMNHCLVGCDDVGLWLLDLRARNGTLAQVPTDATVRIAGASLTLHLGHTAAPAERDGPTLVAPWRDEQDFDRAVLQSVRAFIRERGVELEAWTQPPPGVDGATSLALGTGSVLALVAPAFATVDLRVPRIIEAIAAFVEAQSSLLSDERADEGLIARSPRFRETVRRTREAGRRAQRTLLLGPSGAGKERLAAVYHRHSRRSDGPFKAVNCALLGDEMLWVQLFGASRGAFTGAVREIAGAIESADGGTLFLDEIGDLSPRVQAALLRFLDRGEYEHLGDPRARKADVQLVGATNVDLREAVARGAFRADLWYRFACAVIEVPPLRERPEDVLDFLGLASVRDALHPEALALLLAHDWPGNFRELENLVTRLPSAAPPASLGVALVRAALAEGLVRPPTSATPPSTPAAGRAMDVWDALLARASASWRAEHDGAPETLGQVRAFVEDHLKPAFVAAAAGVDHGARVEHLNLSAIGRRLDILDGTTVRRLLERYLTRPSR